MAAERAAPGVSLVLGLLAVLLPKCPACIAAYLALLGVTVGVAGVVGAFLRPAGFALAALSLGVLLVRGWRRRRRVARAHGEGGCDPRGTPMGRHDPGGMSVLD